MGRVQIPEVEYRERAQRAARLMRERNLDALVVNGNEADYANTRYFSGFWPVFERCGVAINPDGDAALMVGPESDIYAADFGKIPDVFVLAEYRESADPAYPHLSFDTFQKVFAHLGVTGARLRIGVASVLDTNVVMWQGLQNAFPQAELIDARDIMVELRSVKSRSEIDCLREAARITHIATQEVIRELRPGVTELQMVGVAQRTIYENGAEYEGLPMYVFSQKSTKHAISRSSHREIQRGDIVQLNLSAKVDGYSPSIGMPVSLGPLTGEKREIVEFVLQMHRWTEAQLKAGKVSGDIARAFEELYRDAGHSEAYLYGPCHGLGLIEVEAPWMETNSEYLLQPQMTFQIDTFGMGSDFGVRWEKPIAITDEGVDLLSPQIGEIVELDC
ncbi:MAG: aminopeptidase P family protein [Propionibacteriaceae bacterium]|nr:aminopeptidase P family protein [Propionibacteriaceae bacterium]